LPYDSIYRKFIRDFYPRIPAHFSIEMNKTIKILLQVNPSLRLSCDIILQLPFIAKFLGEKHWMEMDEGGPFLLKTIRIP